MSTATSLPAGSLADDVPLSPPDTILDRLADAFDPARLRRWVANEIWRRQPATRLRPLRPPVIDEATPLRWTPGPLIWLTSRGDRVRLGLGDRELVLPGETYGFLRDLLHDDGPVTVKTGDAALDAGSREAVVRRLVAEGALARALSASSAPVRRSSATSR